MEKEENGLDMKRYIDDTDMKRYLDDTNMMRYFDVISAKYSKKIIEEVIKDTGDKILENECLFNLLSNVLREQMRSEFLEKLYLNEKIK